MESIKAVNDSLARFMLDEIMGSYARKLLDQIFELRSLYFAFAEDPSRAEAIGVDLDLLKGSIVGMLDNYLDLVTATADRHYLRTEKYQKLCRYTEAAKKMDPDMDPRDIHRN